MTVRESITELQRRGYNITYRKRSDGGYIITKINGKTFKGAKGNTYARSLLGERISEARAEQLSYNVEKYIKGEKKKATLDYEMKKELRKVQRIWRKTNIHGKITSKKVKFHMKEYGKAEALEYLRRQTRYGQGLAYEENVVAIANYMRDFSKSIKDKDLANALLELANRLESKRVTIKESQLQRIHDVLYEIKENHYDNNYAAQGIIKITGIIG